MYFSTLILWLKYNLKCSSVGWVPWYLFLNIKYLPSSIIKFLTLVSIQFVPSVIPNVTYFKLKLIVMLCLDKNMARFVQKCCTWLHSQKRWFIVSISIEQNSHKAVSLILHFNRYLLVGIIRIKHLYWKFWSRTSFVACKLLVYMLFQFRFSSLNCSIHFCYNFLSGGNFFFISNS